MEGTRFRRWFRHARWRTTDPPWIAPFFAGLACLLGFLAAFEAPGRYEASLPRGVVMPLSYASIAFYVLVWLLETARIGWQRLHFAALVLTPVAWLLFVGRDTLAPLLAMLVAGWLGYNGNARERYIALVLTLAVIAPVFLLGRGEYDNLIAWNIGAIVAWLAGTAMAAQRQTLAALRAAQADLARQAAQEERRRIARDVHDLVAHSLAVTMLHITGARHVLTRDPARAATALAQAETLVRQSLAEIRRTVGLLGDGRSDGGEAPLPGIGDLAALVAELTNAGLSVQLAVSGDPAQLPPLLSLDLYRIAQEALSNAVRHAPGAPMAVTLAVETHNVRLTVRNGPSPASSAPTGQGPGRGLLGMRERSALHSGTLHAGPDNGGWRVECMIPL